MVADLRIPTGAWRVTDPKNQHSVLVIHDDDGNCMYWYGGADISADYPPMELPFRLDQLLADLSRETGIPEHVLPQAHKGASIAKLLLLAASAKQPEGEK